MESPKKNQKTLTTMEYLYFIIIFWITLSSFQGQQSWYLIHSSISWSKCWGSLGKVSAIETATAWNRGIIWFNNKPLTALQWLLKFVVISKLFTSWLITMADHTPNSIYIESEIQGDDYTLGSSKTESIKSSVVIPQKI